MFGLRADQVDRALKLADAFHGELARLNRNLEALRAEGIPLAGATAAAAPADGGTDGAGAAARRPA